MNLEGCHNLRQDERKEPRANGKQWTREEIASQIGSWLWRNGLRAQDHGDLRGQEDLREESDGGDRGGTEFGQRVAG